jgi:hypothetical protein
MAVPTKGSQQKPARNQTIQDFERALKEHNCLQDFHLLVSAYCSAEGLMEAVLAIRLARTHHANLRNAPGRMNSRKLKTLLDKTRWGCQAMGPAVPDGFRKGTSALRRQ